MLAGLPRRVQNRHKSRQIRRGAAVDPYELPTGRFVESRGAAWALTPFPPPISPPPVLPQVTSGKAGNVQEPWARRVLVPAGICGQGPQRRRACAGGRGSVADSSPLPALRRCGTPWRGGPPPPPDLSAPRRSSQILVAGPVAALYVPQVASAASLDPVPGVDVYAEAVLPLARRIPAA